MRVGMGQEGVSGMYGKEGKIKGEKIVMMGGR